MKTLAWDQVNAWRLSQHCLSPRLGSHDIVEAVTHTAGIQAQVMSAAELALWARVDGLAPRDVQSALWQDRTLVKTWMMRGALHLISASELPLYVAARSLYSTFNWPYYFQYYGISLELYKAYLAAAPQILSDQPMTREQFATAVADHLGAPELKELVLSKGWGTPLKPLAWRGDLCFGPSQGQNVTFVHPAKWLGSWQAFDPYDALQEVARRYLIAYGPATPEDFALWWSLGLVPARKLFQSIEDELETVEVDGWRAYALRSTLEPIQSIERTSSINLLPLFDAYTLGIGHARNMEPILSEAFRNQVYRPQGWISAVVLVDGCMEGVWEYKIRRSQTLVKFRMFSQPSASVQKGIEAEAERLGAFLNTEIELAIKEN